MCQDRDGFIWFATDNGVCRFDGSSFKTLTTEDGLPDNDIINVFCDSKNRVWFIPFKKDISYYYRGKVYNRFNDSLIKKINLTTNPVKMLEDKEGRVWISGECGLHYITPNNEFRDFTNAVYNKSRDCDLADIFRDHKGTISFFSLDNTENNSASYSIQQIEGNSNVHITGKINANSGVGRNQLFLNDALLAYPLKHGNIAIRQLKTGLETIMPAFSSFNTYYSYQDTALMINTGDGSWCYNGNGKLIDRFLPGKTIGRSFIDAEGNKWFSSLDDGVYRLGSDKVRQISFEPPLAGNTEVFSIAKYGSSLVAGLNSGVIAVISPEKKISYFYKDNLPGKRFDRVMQIVNLPNNEILCRSDKGLAWLDNNLSVKYIDESAYKSMYVHNDIIYAGTTRNARAWPIRSPLKITIFLKERTTAILEVNDSVYAGTLDGLFLIRPDSTVISLGESIPALKTKVTSVDRSADGILWVGTYSSGMVAIKNNQLLSQITTKNGLTSNNCRTTCISGNNLWVGTDKGLNKIDLRSPGFPVTKFTTADGLPADIINAIFTDSGYVYTGTAAGLTWFSENNTTTSTRCNILLDQVTTNGIEQELSDSYSFSHRQQNIFFHFTAISLKAAGNIVYSYRLRGLDDNWQQTTQQSLNFISLPPGNYNFELYATNKAGVKSPMLSVKFTISTPYWQTGWFKAVLFFGIGALVWLLINRRVHAIRKKEAEKNKVQQQIFELEQKAKRAQMNPHFIFNCISSIQHFIFSNELEACNDYLARFARLIRQTLDNSERSAIQLSEEVKYLDTYLSLEQMRFTGKFTYQITVSPEIQADFIHLPPMLLQPYVENSIRHGVRNRRDHSGRINIDFYKKDNSLFCKVRDNGIGRKMAETMKGASHIEYQSKGMSLTGDRINAISQSYGEHTEVSITDLTGENAESTGTEIVIRFPLSLLEKLS